MPQRQLFQITDISSQTFTLVYFQRGYFARLQYMYSCGAAHAAPRGSHALRRKSVKNRRLYRSNHKNQHEVAIIIQEIFACGARGLKSAVPGHAAVPTHTCKTRIHRSTILLWPYGGRTAVLLSQYAYQYVSISIDIMHILYIRLYVRCLRTTCCTIFYQVGAMGASR